jgi:2-polyprenyl-6-methoxyphenol hydroxylase-like FAD-dependent oxidoreductase
MTNFDALVVGGGVAGCATALELLSVGWRVGLLYQREHVPAIESISPAAAHYLERLSIQVGSDLSEVVAWWGSEREAHAIQPGARIVERSILADALRRGALECGAVVIESGRLLRIERSGDAWEIGCQRIREDLRNFTAKYLIDATGRTSLIGRRLGAQRCVFDQIFCISVAIHQPGLTGVWTESTSEGWWNLCCLPEQGTLSFYSTARIIRESKTDIVTRLNKTCHVRRLLECSVLGQIKVRACGSSQLVPCAGHGWLSVGDATSTLQPLASAGVSKAFRDARIVPRALEREPAQYARFQVMEFKSYLRQLAQHYSLEKRWLATRL